MNLNYKYAFISGNDISKKDINKYGCAGLYNEQVKRCVECQVKTECRIRLNPIAILEREEDKQWWDYLESITA